MTVTKIRSLGVAKCDEDDEQQLLKFISNLRKDQIGAFLARCDLPSRGTKSDLAKRVEEALSHSIISTSELILYLDEVVPWGKQHVFLFNGPTGNIEKWRDRQLLQTLLAKNRVKKYLNGAMPIALPDKLTLSSIQHDDRRLRIVAVHRKIYRSRRPDQDEQRVDEAGRTVELDAYERTVTRGLVIFEWDLVSNDAMLQITQLHSEGDYGQTADEFKNLIQGWLDIDTFTKLDIRKAINTLHKADEAGTGEIRERDVGFRTLKGRVLIGKSPSRQDPLRGERVIDDALRTIGSNELGHIGNFYWQPKIQPASYRNPLTKEVHVYIIGGKKLRVRFPTPNDEATVRYVLQRIRACSQ